jgi:hypothetical protein
MNLLTILIYLILAVGFFVAIVENNKKDTDYLKFPLGLSFMILGLFYLIYLPEVPAKLELSFKDIFILCIIFSPVISALIISFVSPEKNKNNVGELYKISSYDRFMSTLDEAKKAEFKGEWQKAISLYQDTMYYLKNDYKEMSKKDEKEKQVFIHICETSIQRLANRK